ncbi:MAG: DUF885 domain-containing protein [candidate division WOR-3 bacterium]|nr:DUF885 domain-containing protein [candidate division WOR-3 bacterium]
MTRDKLFPYRLVIVFILLTMNLIQGTEIKLRSLAKQAFETVYDFYPVSATYVGFHQYDNRLAHYSTESVTNFVNKLQTILTEVEKINPAILSTDEQIDRELLISNLKMVIFQLKKLNHWQKNPTLYVDECIQGIYLLLLRDFARLSEPAQNVIKRLAQVPRVLSEARQNIINPCRTFTITAIEELKTGEKFIDQSAKELSRKFPELNKDLMTRLRQAIKAMGDYRKELLKILPELDDNFAVGKENFDYMLRTDLFLSFDSDSLLRFGENVFAQTDARINALINQKQKYEMTHPRPGEPALFPPKEFSKKDIIAYEEQEIDSMRVWVASREVATVPDYIGKITVVETPPFLRGILPGLALRPAGPLDSVQTSYLYIRPIPDLIDFETRQYYYHAVKYRRWKSGIVHEAYPGHHFQLSIANHHPSLIRKLQGNTLMIEGWALYCEQMVVDNGLYPDDLFKELRWLGGVRFRAARIILDVMLQTGKMNFDDAVKFMLDRFGPDTAYYQAEVLRYCLSPTQPLSYLVGKTQIMELRDEYRKKMGDQYSLKDFHDKLLAEGSIPISLIQKKLLNQ